MNKFVYIIIYIWVKLHALLPMRVLYVFSDIFYFLIYRIIRYRLKVVRSNMKASFPDKTEKEMLQLERDFYHHFCDYVVETMKLSHISEKEIHRRAHLCNPELIDQLVEKGHSCVLVYMGHYGNWEWFSSGTPLFKRVKVHFIYRPLNNKAIDKLFIYFRTRFGGLCMPKQRAVREMLMLKKRNEGAMVMFLADQTPSKANLHYWTLFLNQDSAIYTGPERIAVKLNLPVVYVDITRKRRGYYEGVFKLITETPQALPEFEITEIYARMMETTIMRNPAYWLWTHKRWKHKHEVQ